MTPVSFEPAIDYVVTKIPRFTFEKFPNVDARLTTQMKSVGEVMAIGRTFQESFQKALRGLEIGRTGLNELTKLDDEDEKARLIRELKVPGADRIWYVADAFRAGMSMADLVEFTSIDPWFLAQIEDLVAIENDLKARRPVLDKTDMFRLKRKGFSDARLGQLLGQVGSGAARAPQVARHQAGVQTRRHVRGGISVGHRVPLLDVRRRMRSGADRPAQDHGARRRPQQNRAGDRVRLLLRARGARDARRRLRNDHGQLQSGNGIDGLRHVGSVCISNR